MVAACGTAAAPPSAGTGVQGERAYQKCYSCHALEAGAGKLQGPTLHQIVGRPIAAEAGFDYSPALRRFARQHPRWTPELLDRYVADPEALVPGTSMTFHGISDAGERRALIGYLERAS
ncbi:MAG TPA: c-type cytochrome [Sphingomicrobium sp.]|nr:c-type cytochrome [Sphingomicrobium sp.]